MNGYIPVISFGRIEKPRQLKRTLAFTGAIVIKGDRKVFSIELGESPSVASTRVSSGRDHIEVKLEG